MDNFEDLLEVQSSERQPNLIRLLNPHEMSGDEMKWVWEHLATQDYAFDDFSRNHPEWFAAGLVEPASLHFLTGEFGYVIVRTAIKGRDCNLHFSVWDQSVEFKEVIEAGRQILRHLFNVTEVQRVTGFIPKFNRQACRFATVMGFKYEGTIRKSCLWKQKYYDVDVYGMLRAEFEQKGIIQ